MNKANNHFKTPNGSPKFHEHPYFNIIYSDSVKTLCDACCSNWMLELIAFYQDKPEVKKNKFQCWELLRATDSTFDVVATDSHNHIIVAHQIPFIHFPYDACTLWMVNNCVILPNEYVNCHTKPMP